MDEHKKPATERVTGTKTKPRAKTKRAPQPDDGNAVTDFLGSREGRATVKNVVRGAFGVLKGFMK